MAQVSQEILPAVGTRWLLVGKPPEANINDLSTDAETVLANSCAV
jgi:hypothetical protein